VSAVQDWIRPWYPGGTVGHIYRECPHLLKWVSEPTEGAGWLDPRADVKASYQASSTCPDCLTRHDPKLAAELLGNDE
jgi:hypothetical protein